MHECVRTSVTHLRACAHTNPYVHVHIAVRTCTHTRMHCIYRCYAMKVQVLTKVYSHISTNTHAQVSVRLRCVQAQCLCTCSGFACLPFQKRLTLVLSHSKVGQKLIIKGIQKHRTAPLPTTNPRIPPITHLLLDP